MKEGSRPLTGTLRHPGCTPAPRVNSKRSRPSWPDKKTIDRRGASCNGEALKIRFKSTFSCGLTSVLDVRLKTAPCHAASLPVALIPNCAATRHVHFTLDGSGPAHFQPPDLRAWPKIADTGDLNLRHVDLDALSAASVSDRKPGETLLVSGTLYTGRDAAHRRMTEALSRGERLPVDLRDKAIYYVGPVNPVRDEVIGPAGPTTSTRVDRYLSTVLPGTGLRVMIGKAERGPEAIAAIPAAGAAYLIAVGGAAYLVAQAIRAAKVVAWPDLGMEAIYELTVKDMPVMVAVDSQGNSVHDVGPAQWRGHHKAFRLPLA